MDNDEQRDIGDKRANELLAEIFDCFKRTIGKLDEIIERQKDLEMKVSGVIEKRNEQRFR